MADTKISALTSVASVATANEFAVNEAGTTKKASADRVAEYVEARSQQGVLCSHASDQAIPTATWTSLEFDTEVWKVAPQRFIQPSQITRDLSPLAMVSMSSRHWFNGRRWP